MAKRYPFITDRAKSAKSRCIVCHLIISKDVLRLGRWVQSKKHDGKIKLWHHFECFFNGNITIKSINDIMNAYTLRNEDQDRLKEKINDISYKRYHIEYSKSETSKCGRCKQAIDEATIRISRKDGYADIVRFHVDCFETMKYDVLKKIPDFDVQKMEDMSNLTDEDQQKIIKKFENWKPEKRNAEGFEFECSPPKRLNEDVTIEKELRHQNDLIWHWIDQLKNQITRFEIAKLLKYNKQFVPCALDDLLYVLSERMVFGSINPCPECGGILSCDDTNYMCTDDFSEWTRCCFESKSITRSEFKIPSEDRKCDAIKDYRYEEMQKIFKNESNMINEPLSGYKFIIDDVIFDCVYTMTDMSERIKQLGGKVMEYSGEDNHNYAALISNGTEDNAKSYVWHAKKYNIDVVKPEFLDNLETEDLFEELTKHRWFDWGRSKDELRHLKASKTHQLGQVLSDNIMKKSGDCIDPDSGLRNRASICIDEETNDEFNELLRKTDTNTGSNSYYRIQLLKSNERDEWLVFRSWGRPGTTSGNNKTVAFLDMDDAKRKFKKIYSDKTGNNWENRDNFLKISRKYCPTSRERICEEQRITLPEPIRLLMKFIFDIKSIEGALTELKIDSKKILPGNLCKRRLEQAYSILNKLRQLIMGSEPHSKNIYLAESNMFYNILPHNFGRANPPILDSLDVINRKFEMIEQLMEMEVTLRLINRVKNTEENYYRQMHNNITVVNKESDTFKLIDKYLRNTHGGYFNTFTLDIVELFEIERENENDRFKKFEDLPNHTMLWHGSKRTSWGGILSEGLQIAPHGIETTGDLFGKGLYFADMVTKAACYCFMSESKSEGLLLLCQVALGKMSEWKEYNPSKPLKEGHNSCHGVGKSIPNPLRNYVDEDGVVYPIGTPVEREGYDGSLYYNEYIVYNVDQVRQRFLVRVKYNIHNK